jgi:hypothetical protein
VTTMKLFTYWRSQAVGTRVIGAHRAPTRGSKPSAGSNPAPTVGDVGLIYPLGSLSVRATVR